LYPNDPTNLQELPAVANNLVALKALLQNPEIVGAPASSIISILNPRNKADLARQLVLAVQQVTDLLLIYYAGHGLIGKQNAKLFLGTMDTTEEYADFDGFDFEEIRLLLHAFGAKKRFLILDCCFSGRALEDAMGSPNSVIDS